MDGEKVVQFLGDVQHGRPHNECVCQRAPKAQARNSTTRLCRSVHNSDVQEFDVLEFLATVYSHLCCRDVIAKSPTIKICHFQLSTSQHRDASHRRTAHNKRHPYLPRLGLCTRYRACESNSPAWWSQAWCCTRWGC
jgi:hypothetical protein